jgi:hypothetical protein
MTIGEGICHTYEQQSTINAQSISTTPKTYPDKQEKSAGRFPVALSAFTPFCMMYLWLNMVVTMVSVCDTKP